MKQFLTIILIILVPFTAHAWIAKVVSVTDGDTIKVFNAEKGQVKIRLYGIDTPEKGQPYGQAAQKYLTYLLAGNIVDIKIVTKDRYGRTVGIVSHGDRNISQEMLKASYAWVYRKYCDKPFCESWMMVENEAKINQKGLWEQPDPLPPWEWRKN